MSHVYVDSWVYTLHEHIIKTIKIKHPGVMVRDGLFAVERSLA